MAKTPELQRKVESFLAECGVPYRIEKGRKHQKVYVGTVMAAILPLSGRAPERGSGAVNNTIAQIRRAIRQQQGQPS